MSRRAPRPSRAERRASARAALRAAGERVDAYARVHALLEHPDLDRICGRVAETCDTAGIPYPQAFLLAVELESGQIGIVARPLNEAPRWIREHCPEELESFLAADRLRRANNLDAVLVAAAGNGDVMFSAFLMKVPTAAPRCNAPGGDS